MHPSLLYRWCWKCRLLDHRCVCMCVHACVCMCVIHCMHVMYVCAGMYVLVCTCHVWCPHLHGFQSSSYLSTHVNVPCCITRCKCGADLSACWNAGSSAQQSQDSGRGDGSCHGRSDCVLEIKLFSLHNHPSGLLACILHSSFDHKELARKNRKNQKLYFEAVGFFFIL